MQINGNLNSHSPGNRKLAFGMKGQKAVETLEAVVKHSNKTGIPCNQIIEEGDKFVPGVRKLTEEKAYSSAEIHALEKRAAIINFNITDTPTARNPVTKRGQDYLNQTAVLSQDRIWHRTQEELSSIASGIQNKTVSRESLVKSFEDTIGTYK